MSVPKHFVFTIQPALDKAEDYKRQCDQAVTDAKKAKRAEEAALAEMIEELARIGQRIRELHDNLVSPARAGPDNDPRQMSRVSASLDLLKLKQEAQKQRIVKQEERVRWAADKVELRKRELAEADARVKSLEKLREKGRAEHAAALAKSEEAKRDDAAIQLWNSQQKKATS